MKKNQPSKKRSDWIYAVVNVSNKGLNISYDPTSDSVEFDGFVAGSQKLVRSYERESGKEKVVSDIPSVKGSTSFDAFENIKKDFDHLIAIDTNTREFNGAVVSVTVAYAVPEVVRSYGNEVPFKFLGSFMKARKILSLDNEGQGWHYVLSQLISEKYFSQSKKLGVVVDSKLGEMQRINDRKLPYFEDQYLPVFARLIYASDAMTDGLPNQMIRQCDVVADAVFKTFARDQLPIPLKAFEHCVQIAPLKDQPW